MTVKNIMNPGGSENVSRIPLLIYLDTMDYSRFADIGHRTVPPGTESVLVFLREKKALGLIAFRYSYTHLVEFLKNPDEHALALRKVQVIEELCGNACFRYVLDVFDGERTSLAANTNPRDSVISDEGEWFPETTVDQETANNLDKLARVLSGLPKSEGRSLLQQMSAKMPLTDFYGSNLSEELLEGRIDPAAFHRAFAKGVAGEPRLFIERYLEGNPLSRKIFEDFAADQRAFKNALVRSREEFMRLKDAPGGEEEMRRYLRRSKFTPSGRMGVEALPAELREQLGSGNFLTELPAHSTFYNVMMLYQRRILYPSHVMPAIKESDAADIMHAAYLPYVDFYRTDVSFADLLKEVSRPADTAIVPKLTDLPGLVEARLRGLQPNIL